MWRLFLEFVIAFSEIYIWDLGARFSYIFRIYITNCENWNLFWKHFILKIKFVFTSNFYVSSIQIFVFDTDQAQIYMQGIPSYEAQVDRLFT